MSAASAERTVQGLQLCLRRLGKSDWPRVAWKFSSLNADGSPLEVAFSSADDKLRYTTEVAGPELDTHARIDAALDLARELGHAAPPPERVRFWRALQAREALRWGAWLSARQGEAGERIKLYLEVPPATASAAGADRHRLALDSRLLMLGYDFESGRYEYYFRQPAPSSSIEASRFLGHFESAPRREVLAAFADLCGVPARTALRWTNFGYSITPRPAQREADLTLFVRSRSLGNVARVRSAFLERERLAGKQTSAYRTLFASRAADALPDHGTVGLTWRSDACPTSRSGGIEMRVGISGAALAQPCLPA